MNTIIHEHIVGKSFATLSDFDAALLALDGTEHKSNLGANAILGCSMAFAVAITHATDLDGSLYTTLASQA